MKVKSYFPERITEKTLTTRDLRTLGPPSRRPSSAPSCGPAGRAACPTPPAAIPGPPAAGSGCPGPPWRRAGGPRPECGRSWTGSAGTAAGCAGEETEQEGQLLPAHTLNLVRVTRGAGGDSAPPAPLV